MLSFLVVDLESPISFPVTILSLVMSLVIILEIYLFIKHPSVTTKTTMIMIMINLRTPSLSEFTKFVMHRNRTTPITAIMNSIQNKLMHLSAFFMSLHLKHFRYYFIYIFMFDLQISHGISYMSFDMWNKL